MATISKPPQILNLLRCPLSPNHFPVSLSLPLRATTSFQSRLGALKTGSDGGGGGGGGSTIGPDLLRKPVVSPRKDLAEVSSEEEDQIEPNRNYVVLDDIDDDDEEEEEGKDNWVDWEDKILEDTVPLVGFVRMILHSGKYESGDRLTPEHERTILERLLPYHPEFEKKIGCGIDYITVGYHPDFQRSRCMFIVQKDGKLVDFSYWKCIKGMIRKNYPLYADSFILRHFRQRRNRNF